MGQHDLEQLARSAHRRVRQERGPSVLLDARSCIRLARAHRQNRQALREHSIWARPLEVHADDAATTDAMLCSLHRLVEPLRAAAPLLRLSVRGYLSPHEEHGFQRLIALALALLADDASSVALSSSLAPEAPCGIAIDVAPRAQPERNLPRTMARHRGVLELRPHDEFGGRHMEKMCVYASQIWREIGTCRRHKALRAALLVALGLSPLSAPPSRTTAVLQTLRDVFAGFLDLRLLDDAFLVVETNWPWFISAPDACALIRHYVSSAEKLRRARREEARAVHAQPSRPKRRKAQQQSSCRAVRARLDGPMHASER